MLPDTVEESMVCKLVSSPFGPWVLLSVSNSILQLSFNAHSNISVSLVFIFSFVWCGRLNSNLN